MVILQTNEDSRTGILHELTEVMRYERLGTAELETVYEKEKAPVQSRKPTEISLPPTQGHQQRGVAPGIPKGHKAFSSKLNTKLQKEGCRGARTLVRESLRQSGKGDNLPAELHTGSLAKRGEIGSLAKRGDILRFPDDFSDIFSRHSSSQLGGSESANHRNAPRTDAEGFVHPIAHPRSLATYMKFRKENTSQSLVAEQAVPKSVVSASAEQHRVAQFLHPARAAYEVADPVPSSGVMHRPKAIGSPLHQWDSRTDSDKWETEFIAQHRIVENHKTEKKEPTEGISATIEVPQADLRPPQHISTQHSSCSFAAYGQTVKTQSRIHQTHDLPRVPQAPSPVKAHKLIANFPHISPEQKQERLAPVTPRLAGDQAVSEVMEHDHHDVSLASSDSHYSEPIAGNVYSIVITPRGASSQISLLQSGSQMKSFDFRELSQQGVEFERVESLSSSEAPKVNAARIVVPRLQQLPPKAEFHAQEMTRTGLYQSKVLKGQIKNKSNHRSPKGSSHALNIFVRGMQNPSDVPYIASARLAEVHSEESVLKVPTATSPPYLTPRAAGDIPSSYRANAQKQTLHRAGVIGVVAADGRTNRKTYVGSAPRAWTSTSSTGKVEPSIAEYGASFSSSNKSVISALNHAHDEESKFNTARNSAIIEGALEKLRVWNDEEVEESSSDGGSDTLDPVNTAKAMPARSVTFFKFPQAEKQERTLTPNTSREEQLCAWEELVKGRETEYASRISRQQSRLGGSAQSTRSRNKFGCGRDTSVRQAGMDNLTESLSRASSYLSRDLSMTGDSGAVHEYMAIRDPRFYGKQSNRVSVVSFFQEPAPPFPTGTIMRGGKKRLHENPNLVLPCDQLMQNTVEKEDRFHPVPPSMAHYKYDADVLRSRGIQPFVMDWGSGMAMQDVSFEKIFDETTRFFNNLDEVDTKLKYHPKQKVSDSQVRSSEVRRHKIICENPAVYEERAIKFIKNRERLLKRLQTVIARIPRGETDPDSGVRRELCTVMLDLRACSVLLIESVSNWQRACGPKPREFVWENQDYLQKLMLDTDFVESYAYVAETLCVQGPFFLSFAPLHAKSEIKHAMLVRADQDDVPQEKLVNSPTLPDAQRIVGVLEYLRSRNERVKFKSVDTLHRYDADGEEAETLTIPSTSKRPLGIGSSESKEAQEIKLQEETVSQEAKEQRVSQEESEEKEQRVSQEDTVSQDSTFEELHFSHEDGISASSLPLHAPRIMHAKIVLGDTTIQEKEDLLTAEGSISSLQSMVSMKSKRQVCLKPTLQRLSPRERMPSKMKKTPGNRHSSKTPDQIMALKPGEGEALEQWWLIGRQEKGSPVTKQEISKFPAQAMLNAVL